MELAAKREGAAVNRLHLALIAIAADIVLTVALVFPIALPIAIGTLFFNHELFYWIGAIAIVLIAWLVRPSFTFNGRALRREEAPALYEALEELRQKLGVPKAMDVYLDDSFNASAGETHGFFGLLGTRYELTLGVPLLVALSRTQVLAIIAHEFGHFSRRHGRLGHWIYRARIGWNHLAQFDDAQDSPFDRATAWYAREFVPFFNRLSFAHSRQCEYEADADAADAAGSKAVAEALTRTIALGYYWERELPKRIAAWKLEAPEAPPDFYDRFAAGTRGFRSDELEGWLRQALAEPPAPLDTHPGLTERLRALNEPPGLGAPSDNNAGESLLGPAWPAIVAEYNAKWTKQFSGGWLAEHLRLKHIVQPLLAANADAARTWHIDRRLARARALRTIDPAAGLAELRALHEADPGHQRTRFAYGAALLSEDNADGLEHLEALARQAPAFRAEAFSRILAYYQRKDIRWHIDRWSAWHKQAYGNRAAALEKFLGDLEDGKVGPGSLSGAERAVLTEAVRLDPVLTKGSLFEGEASLQYATDRAPVPIRVHLLAVIIDTAEAQRREQEEEAVGNRYLELMRSLLPPDEAVLVRTHLTTEILLARYLEKAVPL